MQEQAQTEQAQERQVRLKKGTTAPYWATAAPQKQGQDEERQTAQEQTQTKQAQERHLQRQVWLAEGSNMALQGPQDALLKQGHSWTRPEV